MLAGCSLPTGLKDKTVALHQLPLLIGTDQHHPVLSYCPTLLCPVPALQQGVPPAALCPQPLLPPAQPPCPFPAWGWHPGCGVLRGDPSSRETQPGHDGAYSKQQVFPLLPLALSSPALPALALPAALPWPLFPICPLPPHSRPHSCSLCPCLGRQTCPSCTKNLCPQQGCVSLCCFVALLCPGRDPRRAGLAHPE